MTNNMISFKDLILEWTLVTKKITPAEKGIKLKDLTRKISSKLADHLLLLPLTVQVFQAIKEITNM